MGTIAGEEEDLGSKAAAPAEAAPSRRRLLPNPGLLRIALLAATAGFYAAAVAEHPHPLVMAVGLAPIVWLALEAVWVLCSFNSKGKS